MYPLVHLPFDLTISSYILVLSLVSCGVVFWTAKRAEDQRALDLLLAVFITGFVGARLFHILYEDFDFYFKHPGQIFAIWQGGFVWYGGVLGGLLGAALWCKIQGEPFLKWANFFAPTIAIAYGLGRIACFLNGCCYGKICEFPWGTFRHPTQLYMVAYELILAGFLLKSKRNQFMIWLGFHGLGRFIIEFFRDDPRGPSLGILSISSILSAMMVVSSVTFLLYKKN